MRRRWLRRAAFALLALLILLALPALYIHGWCGGGTDAETAPAAALPPAIAEGLRAAAGYRRAEARSFLTYPEWYIVFTSQDYAGYIARKRPSGFRYFASAFAFWTSYCDINRYVMPRYAFDSEIHIVNYVIGVSHSVELIVKGLYETIIGRLSELFAPNVPTAEERFAQAVFADYGNFLRTTPWYEYPFARRREELALVDTAGPGQVRKWERRIALWTELAVKSVYAGMIRGGTQSAFEAPVLTTVAVVRDLPPARLAAAKEIESLARADRLSVLAFPRYAPFADLVRELADSSAAFAEIAGNDEILVTAIMDRPDAALPAGMQAIFRTDLLSGAAGSRVGMVVPVAELMRVIRDLRKTGGRVEHIYDY
jgi:hypothetical protein